MTLPARRRDSVIPGLDGVRALALLLVLGAHTGFVGIPGGFGVTVFFVLSGFLITTLLRAEYRRSGDIDVAAFYLRRVLRLLPPLLVVVAMTGLLARAGWITGGFSTEGLLSVLFYFGNYWMIAEDFQGIPAGIGVTWSLAVEEQYYLLFPPLLLFLLRRGEEHATRVIAVLSLAVLAWRCCLYAAGVGETYISMATETRVDAILIGALLALRSNPWLEAPPWPHSLRESLVAVAAIAMLLATLLWRDAAFRATFRYSLQALAIAPLLWLAVARSAQAPWRWLNARTLAWLGGISYATYLVHQVVFLALLRHWPALPPFALALLTILLSLLIATAVRHWVELPCQHLRARLSRDSHVTATGIPSRAKP